MLRLPQHSIRDWMALKNRHLFSHRKSKARCQQSRLLPGSLSLVCKWPSSPYVLIGLSLCVQQCPDLLFLKEHQSQQIRIPIADFDLITLKDAVARDSPILTCQRSGFQGGGLRATSQSVHAIHIVCDCCDLKHPE